MLDNKFLEEFRGFIFSLMIFMFLASCSQKSFDSREELVNYLADLDNGYSQTKSNNGIDFSISYRPTDMMVQQELANGENTQKFIDSLRTKYRRYMYFKVSISKDHQEILSSIRGNQNKYSAMVNQLAFGMSEKVHMFSKSKDTIGVADYIYPRLYGMGGGTSMLFIYPWNKKLMSYDFFYLTIEDIGLNTGEIGFKIPTRPIKNQPKLNL